MNYYAFIPLCTFVINIFTWTYIYTQKRHTAVNRAYLALAAFSALWMFDLFILWSPVPDDFLMPLEKITTITGFIVAFLFVNFTYEFLEKKKDFIYYFLSTIVIVSIIIDSFTNYYVYGYTKYHWGVSLQPGKNFLPIVFGIFVAPMLFSLFLLYKRRSSVNDKNMRNQLTFLLQGTTLFFLVNITSDFILPHIFHFEEIVRIGIPAGILQSLFTFLAVRKYNFLSISFEEICNSLFDNLKDGIVIVDNNENIVQMNDYAKKIFNLENLKINIKISDLITDYRFQDCYKDYEGFIHSKNDKRLISMSQANIRQYSVDLGKILIIRDITENKKAQIELYENKEKLEKLAHELAEMNASLEQKVLERTILLQSSNEQLLREINERERAEAALAAETERLSITLRSIGDGVITTDIAGTIVLLNPAAEHLTGWAQEQALGRPLHDIFSIIDEKTGEPCPNLAEEVLQDDGFVDPVRYSILRAKDGAERIITESGAPILDKEGRVLGVVLVFRDMTEKRKLEEELIRADKLESMGLLAGGIAHDFNNVLTAIIGNLALAKLSLHEEQDVLQILDEAEKASLRATNLTQQLLTFSKGGLPIKKLCSIKNLIKEWVEFSSRGSNIRPVFFIQDDLWPANIDEGQINQVINNLIINACQAMERGGLLEIHAKNMDNTETNTEQILHMEKGKYIEIAVKDQGLGITEEHLQKIFDPYFTTKEKGSGLGLFTAYAIIKKHHGYLRVDSEVGIGTTFYIYLPATEVDLSASQDRQASDLVGTGKILVMDDEEMIREMTRALLERFGYEVELAKDGIQALEIYQQASHAGRPFDAILLDLTIPGSMGGKETVRALHEFDPAAKAIVVSGYSNDPILAEYHHYGFCGYLVKPYPSQELLRVLSNILKSNESL